MEKLYGIGDRVSLVQVDGDRVVNVTGTVVGLATVGGLAFVKVDGLDEWKASEEVRLVLDGAERRLP